jgi:hypothetical protein
MLTDECRQLTSRTAIDKADVWSSPTSTQLGYGTLHCKM